MHFWFVHTGEVSLREQICTQVVLAIVSGELRGGQRLPSTREMARRFGLHPNTVSAAYQQLQEQGAVERRHGAGIFVRENRLHGNGNANAAREQLLDRMIANFLTATRQQGFSNDEIIARARRWIDLEAPDHFLLVEPTDERREILLAELQPHLRLPLRACPMVDAANAAHCIALALPTRFDEARSLIPPHIELVRLQVTNVPADLHEWLPVPVDALVGIVSRWPDFVQIARTMLVATAFNPDAMVERIRGQHRWHDGLEATSAVVCDVATVPHLPAKVRAIPFRLVSEGTLKKLREMEAGIIAQLSAPVVA